MPMSADSRDYGRFDELAEEFAERYRRGEKPSLQEYIDRCPDLAPEIREMFPALAEVERVEGDARADNFQPTPPASALSELRDYRIVRKIGRGGMGVVYEAEQISLGRRVALKVLPRHVVGDRKALERFRREAKAAARLHHTNIVPVFEVGHEDSVTFYTMQFIHGQGLDQVIDELARLRSPDGSSDPDGDARIAGQLGTEVGISGSPAGGGRAPRRGQVAESVLSGRLGSDRLNWPTRVATAATEKGATEPIDPPPILFDSSVLNRHELGSRPPAADGSISAVLPGGTAVSMVESSVSRQPFFRSVAQIGRQVAQGLAHAHSRGIIHRDIKPSNLLLDTAGIVWITDFGLAKAEEDGLTASGDILGTFRYMSPERFRGEGDARADIYALGLTLYELLTLKPAFDTGDRLTLIERIKSDEPARPRLLDGRIPRDLETIVLKAIEKDPKERYTSADAMADDLRRFLDDEPILARRTSVAERFARWARHHPGIAVLAAILTAVLVLTTVASLIVADRMARLAENQRRAAEAERVARQEASRTAKAEFAARAEADLARAASEKSQATAQAEIYHRILSKARALRARHPPGWREETLADIAQLGTMPTPLRDLAELRTEATATLAMPDIHLVARFEIDPEVLGSFSFSRDGRTLVTAGRQAGLDFWDVSKFRHLSFAQGMATSDFGSSNVIELPDGKGLVVATRDRGVVFSDSHGIPTSRTPITLGKNQPTRLSMSADGQRMAVDWTDGGGITVHDVASGSVIDRFNQSPSALSPDGRWLACQKQSEIVLLPVASRETAIVLGRHAGALALAWSPDGAMLAVAFLDHTTVLWDVAKREQYGTLRGHRERVHDAAFSHDGKWLATASLDYTVRIWETRTGQNLATLSGSAPAVRVQWSPTSDYLATSLNSSREVLLYKVTGRHVVQRWLTGHQVELRCVAAHPRLERFTTSGYSELIAWDLSVSPPFPVSIGPNPGAVTAVAYNPDGSLVATASWLGTEPREVVIRESSTGKVRSRFSSGTQVVFALAFDPTGARLACGDRAGNVILWDLATSRPIHQFVTGSAVSTIIFLASPCRMLTHGRDAVLLYNVESGELERKVTVAGGSIQRLAADPVRSRLVVGFEDGAIGGLSIPDLTPGLRLERAHEGSVDCLTVSPDGRLVASGGSDHRVVLRDATTFEPLLALPLWVGNLRDLTFDFQGRHLIIVGTDCDVDLWDLSALYDGLAAVGLAWDQAALPAVVSGSGLEHQGEPIVPSVQVVRRKGAPNPASTIRTVPSPGPDTRLVPSRPKAKE
jgi:WD40 repeat protein